MPIEQLIVFGVLVVTLGLFAWGRWRHDVVALFAMLAVVFAGIVPPEQALLGFGHPAVITVAAVLVISRALRNSGIVDLLAQRIMPYTASTFWHIVLLTGVVAIASAFMNNVGALALMLPVALTTAATHGRSPAILLMPLAFGSILGGLITLIGTPPNVIIATYRAEVTGAPFQMFDFAPVGLAIALVGIVFVALIGWRLLPRHRQAPAAQARIFEMSEYIVEVKVGETSDLIDQPLGEVEALTGDDVVPVGLVRDKNTVVHPSRFRRLRAGDMLVLKADPADLKPVLADHGLELMTSGSVKSDDFKPEDLHLVEALVTPGSPLEGRDSSYLRRRAGRTVSLLALARSGKPIRSRLRTIKFEAGDVLLLQGDEDTIGDALGNLSLLPLAERDLQLGQPRRIGLAIAVFAAALGASAFGLVPVAIAFLAAIIAYIVLDILPVREIYREIDWPVIVLLGGMIPVGKALEISGATAMIADGIVGATAGLPPVFVLALVLVVTMTLSDLVNNAATALIMAPIAVAIAYRLDVAIDPFLMAVAVGASCAFLTPIGHQSNTLVMGPGGYRFGDYWRMGLPLEVLIVAVAVPMITIVWPF